MVKFCVAVAQFCKVPELRLIVPVNSAPASRQTFSPGFTVNEPLKAPTIVIEQDVPGHCPEIDKGNIRIENKTAANRKLTAKILQLCLLFAIKNLFFFCLLFKFCKDLISGKIMELTLAY